MPSKILLHGSFQIEGHNDESHLFSTRYVLVLHEKEISGTKHSAKNLAVGIEIFSPDRGNSVKLYET